MSRRLVMLSLADDNALAETAHLLRSPANTQGLLSAIQELNAEGATERQLAQ